MGSQNEQGERIEALRALIERLTASDLTLSEARVLRSQLAVLLEPGGGPPRGNRTGPLPVLGPYHDIGGGPRENVWSPITSMWSVG